MSSTSEGSADYEVFLSFRGEDTRTGFTDHLYTHLEDAGIRTFRDNDRLHIGEEIGPELLKMIQRSKICIPILSKNYASSKWCLIELTQMTKCRKNLGQMIMPVFYDVPPEVVKHRTESFGEAFLEHERNFDVKTVQEWTEALKEVGNLKGWEKGRIYDGHEAKLVKEIVAEVCIKLNTISVEIPDELVGMSHHVEVMTRILDIDSEGVRVIGIHGMGGIGKTTMAKFMYKQLAKRFQPFCSFIEDIREEATKHKDLVHLQNRLIRDILKVKDFNVGTVCKGKKWIEDKLRDKKVLIVLDDVDDQSQLRAVAGEASWFGSGSRIIVTTRDKAVLNAHKVTGVYEPEGMSLDHSLQLFSLHAFKETPPADFYDIAVDIVSTGEGLPLFLEVVGSLLSGHLENKPFWESTSKKLKSIPNEDVLNKLKISYDTLDDAQRAIFLDIACHFIGFSRRLCVYMWDDCEFFGENGLGVLVSRSLVKIGEDNKFLMHDLVRDLGRHIVRQENAANPEKRSRLWLHKNAKETLIECKGTKNVQTLTLSEPWYSRENVPGEAFMTLSTLRYLQMTGANLRCGFKGPLRKLLWLSLTSISWTPIGAGSSHLCLENLVVLELFKIDFLDDDELQNLIKMSTNLKVLQIKECKRLTRTPDFSSFPNLEIISLRSCPNLVEISPSIKHLNHLTSFYIIDCPYVSELPKDFGSMEALTELSLDGTGVKEISVLKGSMKKLHKLSAKGCHSLTHISSIVHLHSLQYLNFDSCKSLSEIPDSIGLLVELQHLSFMSCKLVKLPTSIGSLVKVQHLSFHGCKSLVDLPESMGLLVNLQYLSFRGCESLVKLPRSIGLFVKLQHLSFDGCYSLVNLHDSLFLLVNLQHLSFKGCESLMRLPSTIWSLVNLQNLSFDGCYSLVNLPDSMGSLVNLQYLSFTGCQSLMKLPRSVGSLVKLQLLLFDDCKSLPNLPDSICSLANLQQLSFRGCQRLVKLPSSFGSLVKLQKLSFNYCMSLIDLPESMCSLVNLLELSFIGCESLVKLPNSIGSLVKLQHLSLSVCKSLVGLPDSMCSLVNLLELSFIGCVSLVKLPNSIGSLVKLQHLSFDGCRSLDDLPDSMCSLVNLQYLSFIGCVSLVKLPNSIGSLVKLQHLSFDGCRSLVDLPDSMCSLVNLQHLSFKRCASLMEIPDSIGSLVKLQYLSFNGCKSLVDLPDSICSLVNLQDVSVAGCASLVDVSCEITRFCIRWM